MSWIITAPDDLHTHLRQGSLGLKYAQDARNAGWKRVLAMPNTLPPLIEGGQITQYKKEMEKAAPGLELIVPFKIQESMGSKEIKALKSKGVIVGKYYPAGSTTNSQDGVSHYKSLFPLFEAMEEQNMVLSIHGEDPSAYSLDREAAFLPRLEEIHRTFPKLRIVLEHVSSRSGIEGVLEMGPQVAGGITIHHLLFTLDDLIGGNLSPHFFCKPILKSPEDRRSIQKAALSGNPKFFFGSDSAPHLLEDKQKDQGHPGVYSMPVSLSLLAEFFTNHGKRDALEPFISHFGADFYQIPRNQGKIEIHQEPWEVPEDYHGTRPLLAGHKMTWKARNLD